MQTNKIRWALMSVGIALSSLSILSSNSSGPSSDYSGSPFSAVNSCATCHSGNYNPGTGLTLSGLPANYVPGTAYTLTLSIDNATSKNGFQGIALRSSNNAVAGSFTAGVGMQIKTISSRGYIEHNTGSSTGSWTFTWTAPSNYQGALNFFFAGNATNSNNNTSGDAVYTGTWSTATTFSALTATNNKTNVSCNGACDGTASVTVSGGASPYQYTWSAGSPVSGSPNAVTNLCNGTYTVTIEDANGVEITRSIIITQPSAITSNTNSSVATCATNDGTASVSASGGTSPYSYMWSNGGQTASLSNVGAGWYYVTVTDANGCVKTDSTEVLVGPSGLTANMSSMDAHCGQLDGEAEVSMLTGASPYTYLWSSGGTGFIESGLSAGTYTVTVTDANACVDSFSVTVGSLDGPSITGFDVDSVVCHGSSSGSVAPMITGGNQPYTYMWSNGSTDSILVNVPVGMYSVDVTDANGCLIDATAEVFGPDDALLISLLNKDDATDGNCNGAIEVEVNGDYADQGYTLTWNDPDNTQGDVLSSLCAGVYQGIAVDVNGCSDTLEVEVGDEVTSVSEANQMDVRVFPNPVRGQLTIAIAPNAQAEITVYGLDGKRYINQSLNNSINRVSTSQLPVGIYVLHVQSKNQTFVKRIHKL